MKTSQVRKKLIAEGCSESNFAVMKRGDDVFCLDKSGKYWVIFYSERGKDSEPIFKSKSEDEACQFFFNYIMSMEHWHIVGFFKEEDLVKKLEAKLLSIGIKTIRNDIPSYKSENDPRYRLFVIGKDIFRVREVFGKISINFG